MHRAAGLLLCIGIGIVATAAAARDHNDGRTAPRTLVGQAPRHRLADALPVDIGTTICGASTIAALAPVICAKAEEIVYTVTVVVFFNMVAVFSFPALGHLLGLSDTGFRVCAGTAVYDTSGVVAAGFAFSQAAGTTATIVKLTRTTLIIPLVLGFGLPFLECSGTAAGDPLRQRVQNAASAFIILFVLAAGANTLGLIGGYASQMQLLGRLVMVVAPAAVGLLGHWRAFAGASTRPLMRGLLA